MAVYLTRDVAKLVGLTPRQVRSYARAGVLTAIRDRRGWYRYTLQDVVLLRTAVGLSAAHVGPRKIWAMLRKLKRNLSQGRPLSTVRVLVQDSTVLVKDRDALWHPESGQLQLDFSVHELAKEITPLIRKAVAAANERKDMTAEEWFGLGVDLEMVSENKQAEQAYREALSMNPTYVDAHVRLGRLVQLSGDVTAAEVHYRAALKVAPEHVIALTNLASSLEARNRFADAIATYNNALRIDPELTDAHYHLARLYEQDGKSQAALHHISRYNALTGNKQKET